MKTKFTHEGRIGICPIYANPGNPDNANDDMLVTAKYPYTDWLLSLTLFVCKFTCEDGVPGAWLRELDEPYCPE